MCNTNEYSNEPDVLGTIGLRSEVHLLMSVAEETYRTQ